MPTQNETPKSESQEPGIYPHLREQEESPNQSVAAQERVVGVEVLAGKVILKFKDFGIAMPQGSPVCSTCSKPTHDEEKNDGDIVLSEDSMGDDNLKRDGLKWLLLTAGTNCTKCGSRSCWACIDRVGLGSCPKCQTALPLNPYHGNACMELLDDRQKAAVMRKVGAVRKKGTPGDRVCRVTHQELKAAGWNDVDSYFGHLYAWGVNQAIASGTLSEDDLDLPSQPVGRRIISLPGKDGQEFRVAAGTAYAEEDADGLSIRVMAECEDGQVRCVAKNMFGEAIVSMINKK